MAAAWDDQTEWLETDGLGGFAMGTVGGIRTRRYHGLLIAATVPPVGREVLVNGLEVFVTTPAGRFPLSSQRYDGQVVFPEGFRHVEAFHPEPWPTWRFQLPDATRVEQQICMRHGHSMVAISWRMIGAADKVRLEVRPLLSGRDHHALHRENSFLRFDATQNDELVQWQTYPKVPPITARSNATYRHDPLWYRRFFYQEEWLRGFEALEDLASPGVFTWALGSDEAVLVLSAGYELPHARADAVRVWRSVRDAELERRARFSTPLHRAADQYIVRRDAGRTIIAGYPWFGDWGRDSFISVRGLCLALGRYDDALDILLGWADFVSQGMLPNRFPDSGQAAEYNSVDAALWYVIAVHELLADAADSRISAAHRQKLQSTVESIINGYVGGTRYGIRLDDDGLLAAGEPGSQLTWMDARVDGRSITPRVGKPVEVQALWINALRAAETSDPRWHELFTKACHSFREKFWDQATGGLVDVVDCDHRPGNVDRSIRPNQIFCVGGLPLVLLESVRAMSLVELVERRLWTPMGLRSLAPGEGGYTPRYSGNPGERDAAYHQGTVWPWLAGPFIEAWVRVRGGTSSAKAEAMQRLVSPLLRHLGTAGLGHVSEIADAEPPHMPRGCPFQAWSVAELLRVQSALTARSAPTVQSTPEAEESTQPETAGHPICG